MTTLQDADRVHFDKHLAGFVAKEYDDAQIQYPNSARRPEAATTDRQNMVRVARAWAAATPPGRDMAASFRAYLIAVTGADRDIAQGLVEMLDRIELWPHPFLLGFISEVVDAIPVDERNMKHDVV